MDKSLPPEGAVALGVERAILVYPIIDETTYAVAMHEMGHLVAPGGMGAISKSLPPMQQILALMEQEDVAWVWARTNALRWTDLMESIKVWARESYRTSLVDTCKATYIRRTPGRPISDWGKR